ncbi:MAG: LytTR family DNA-binding domain-containing protein [Bacillota bacterium]
MENAPELTPGTARRIFVWQLLFFGVLLFLACLENISTVLDDHARAGDLLPAWKPAVWEGSSHLMVFLLIPALAWVLAHFPLTRLSWWRSLPAYLTGAVLFSLLHVEGMVLLRRLAYAFAGERYDFGPFWLNWPYELRKDLVTFIILTAGLQAFRVYGLWLDARAYKADPDAAVLEPRAEGAAREKLVVRKLNREFILDAGEIDRVEADGNYVIIHAGGQSYRLRESLEGLARRLDEQRFARVHRGHVVNIDRIREIQPWDHGDYRILLKDGSFVNFSRRYRNRLNHLFQ